MCDGAKTTTTKKHTHTQENKTKQNNKNISIEKLQADSKGVAAAQLHSEFKPEQTRCSKSS